MLYFTENSEWLKTTTNGYLGTNQVTLLEGFHYEIFDIKSEQCWWEVEFRNVGSKGSKGHGSGCTKTLIFIVYIV